MLHSTTLDPAARLALAQELVPSFQATEGTLGQVVRVVQAERAVIDQARTASEDSWFNSELAAAVQELQAALTTNP
ncbi:MAG TPA: hypothetical protein VFS21_07100 [Roseiflexaceae bacterium]|nr:hypothetical protein [Roseiflexaceae bacterium]